ncbi:MAG: S-adenosylmethionine:tRNA ribosyltransferase-isomerase, partial [Candidatus Saganbacteria bacterium]|nr:S-adenosylmethionine:tRNA ribosyltransferase-isomerase [Candidatus Saganbacteria bacterium]
AEDIARYQTVYAKRPGAVAAPTAGLHFDWALLEKIERMGVRQAVITLDVGEGTFKPVKTERLEEHPMHAERFCISEQAAETINQCRAKGGRVIAVGTTSVRTVENAVRDGLVMPGTGRTNLFILPGFKFQAIDAMITNFHLPRSTLLALVAAFAGLEQILRAYRHAVEKRYRFYSYGDAMLIV